MFRERLARHVLATPTGKRPKNCPRTRWNDCIFEVTWSCLTEQISELEESVHDAQCVVTAQLQQESSVTINFSITMSVNHTLPQSCVVPTCALESPKRIVDWLVLTLRRASLISSTNSGYSALAFGPHICIKHRELPKTSTYSKRFQQHPGSIV